jgi:hypothetical protein
MSIVEIDAYLRNSQQKVDNASNSKKSASQARFDRFLSDSIPLA